MFAPFTELHEWQSAASHAKPQLVTTSSVIRLENCR